MSKSSALRMVTCRCAPLARKRSVLSKMGRPNKLQEIHKLTLIRALKKIRAPNVNFTLTELVKESGLNMTMVSKRTFYRFLREHGYHFLQARQKGLVTVKDRKKRIRYTREMKRHLIEYNNCCEVSFIHKGNPMSEASSPKVRVWRKNLVRAFRLLQKGLKIL